MTKLEPYWKKETKEQHPMHPLHLKECHDQGLQIRNSTKRLNLIGNGRYIAVIMIVLDTNTSIRVKNKLISCELQLKKRMGDKSNVKNRNSDFWNDC